MGATLMISVVCVTTITLTVYNGIDWVIVESNTDHDVPSVIGPTSPESPPIKAMKAIEREISQYRYSHREEVSIKLETVEIQKDNENQNGENPPVQPVIPTPPEPQVQQAVVSK